jgi:hypothetical protein
LNLEVDGSLANPYAAAAVAIWTVALSILAVLLVRGRDKGRGWQTVELAARLVLASAVTWIVQPLLGNILYMMTDHRIGSVGFWGGPPNWIAPSVAAGAGCVAWVRRRGAAADEGRGRRQAPRD